MPARAPREAPPEPPDAPGPKAPDEAAGPTPHGEPAPAEAVVTEGIRLHVLADGQPLPDAHVYATIGQEPQTTIKEEGATWLVAATGDVVVGADHEADGAARRDRDLVGIGPEFFLQHSVFPPSCTSQHRVTAQRLNSWVSRWPASATVSHNISWSSSIGRCPRSSTAARKK